MKNTIIILIVIAIVLLAVSGYLFLHSGNKDASVQTTSEKFFSQNQVKPTDVTVTETVSGFEPSTVSIKKGTKVTFLNTTDTYVWPASDPHPTHTGYPGFDPLEPFKKGEAWSFIFDKVGTYGFHDHLKPSVKGIIVITE